MEYQCSACGIKVSADMLVYREHINKHIVDLLKVDHPEWVEQGGICKKCIQYYESELKGSPFHDAACVKRTRGVKAILGKISGVLRNAKRV